MPLDHAVSQPVNVIVSIHEKHLYAQIPKKPPIDQIPAVSSDLQEPLNRNCPISDEDNWLDNPARLGGLWYNRNGKRTTLFPPKCLHVSWNLLVLKGNCRTVILGGIGYKVNACWTIFSPCYIVVSGDHLRLCPQGRTCCTEAMEEKLRSLGKQDFVKMSTDALASIRHDFMIRSTKFEGMLWWVLFTLSIYACIWQILVFCWLPGYKGFCAQCNVCTSLATD